ncbi:MAG: hypothetical protein A3D34_00525 [Candidatus Staskawiczbacteria bacterium RIFCSPHIGHO2_02_FULL_33_16]|uniref:POTRA domain-containing protein n=1 Tax=Candidatus Staskawiczbacteria bacterium RIFCSPHIGHO2_02_FULL_33_16 TaxID=1802204 RepID=A0A1G2HW16_9BACT|nr:MAG: hypothetical protein A3D34_00525 [Candidatus Staskawiczbacteria bacterium RIFCSPHIGHO2_02_FULL_33_16]OGZ70351.1 MAG: hypothetical protein A2980_01810 [Candidatus Staskawiczbacteria bacterium RIFCSPLOWO2_01_FULL_33_13]
MSYRRKHITPKIRRLKNKKIFFKRPSFLIPLFIVIIAVILYFALFSNEFQVQKIQVSGNEKIQSPDIETIAWDYIQKDIFTAGIFTISSKSIFIADTKNVIKNILHKFPDIEDIKIQKKFFNDIHITVKERRNFATLCQNTECFLLDNNGVVFQKLQHIPENMIIIKKTGTTEISLGNTVIDKNTIAIILEVENNLKNNFQIGIKEVAFLNPLIFKTSENWHIYLDPNNDIEGQIAKMNALLKDEITVNTRKNIEYIYLQYKDRAYYK